MVSRVQSLLSQQSSSLLGTSLVCKEKTDKKDRAKPFFANTSPGIISQKTSNTWNQLSAVLFIINIKA